MIVNKNMVFSVLREKDTFMHTEGNRSIRKLYKMLKDGFDS